MSRTIADILAENAADAYKLLRRVYDEAEDELGENNEPLECTIIPDDLFDEIEEFFEKLTDEEAAINPNPVAAE